MRNYKRLGISAIAVILTMLTAFMLPIQVFAEAIPDREEQKVVSFDNLNEETADANIVSELTERRDKYTKHFRMDDGTIMAVTYDCPVHYKNDKGKWIEYNNTLVAKNEATADEAAPEFFTNKKSNIDIDLAPDTKTDDLVSISSKKGNISWEYTGANKSVAKIKNNNKKHKGNEKFTSIDKLTSQASYNGIYNNVDLDCIVSTTGVKENIILKSADAQNEFEIDYNIKGLKAKQTDEKTIELYKGKKLVYTITAPYMYDADGNTSNDLSLEILSNKGNKLSVKLIADKGFLHSWGRKYPVTIDPEVSLNGPANTETAYVTVNQPNVVYKQQTDFNVGRSKYSGYTYSGLVKLKNIQENYSDKNIVSAKLNLFPMDAYYGMEIEAYPITSSWTNSTATYNNVTYDSEIIDYAKTKSGSFDAVSFDVTKYVKKWANGSFANNGIYLKSNDSAASFGGYHCYYANRKPTFVVKYKEYTGLESNLTSHTVACGQNAEAAVSDYTGALNVKQKIYEESGARIPLSIYATHNSQKTDQRSYIGRGWHMSFDKRITNTGTYYVYLDGDAVEHYFKIESGKTELYDEDDLGYTLTIKSNSIEIDSGSTVESYNIPSENQTTYINTETDSENSNNRITYYYASAGKISKIVSAQHTYTFYYTTVTSEGKEVTVYHNLYKDNSLFAYFVYYVGHALTSGISFSDGRRSNFAYVNPNLRLGSIRQYSNSDAQNGQKLGFTYENDKVKTITEYGKNDASRRSLAVKYNDNNTTEFTDLNGNKETYTFDDYGNTVTVLNANGMITNGSDSGSLGIATGSDSYTKNYVDVSSEPNSGGFVKVSGTVNGQLAGGSLAIDSTTSYLGQKSVKITHSSKELYTYARRIFNLENCDGKTMTFSAYVKTKDLVEGTLSGQTGAYLKIKFYNSSNVQLSDTDSVAFTDTITGSDWERLSVTVTVPSGTKSCRIFGMLRNVKGTAWFDCFQLEEGSVMNDYNALANSDFTSTSDWIYRYKDKGDTSFHTTTIPLGSDGDVHLSGKGCEPKSVQSQDWEEETEATVATEIRIETETINNDIVETTDNYGNVTKTMQGYVTRKYKRTYEVTEPTEADNSSSTESDDDSEDSIDSVNDCNNYIYQVVDVNQKYVTFNISGTAKAKSIPLNSDYRTFGIALKIKYQGDSDFTESHYQEFNAYTDIAQNIALSVIPDESDKEVEKVAFAFVYGYNKNEMVIKNAMLNFAYDYQFGGNEESSSNAGGSSSEAINEEIISEAVSTSKKYMQTSSDYNPENNEGKYGGNYVISGVDEAGHSTSYTYDSNGNKTSVTDAKNNTTSYTYDNYGNILSVASGSSSYSNTYTPTNQLSTISNSGTSYSFEYDNFDNVKTVKVGSQTLVTNNYDSIGLKLTSTSYGNGGVYTYNYDTYGRITSIGGAGHGIAGYTYNKKGLITKYYDYWLQQTTHYYYDCNGNLIAKYAEGTDNKLAFNIAFDTNGNTVEQTNIDGRYHNIVRGIDSNDDEYVKNDGVLVTTVTDDFGRKEDVSTQFTLESNKPTYHTEYEYLNGSAANSTTNLVGTISYSYGNNSTDYDYIYDANNNIAQVIINGTVTAKYTYDSLNQLKTSADKNANTYTEYYYDTKGNITSTKAYNLALSLSKGSTLQKTNTYTYGDSNWGDKLTKYNNQTITYDAIGNPLTYRDSMSMQWINGRQLKQITTSNDTVEFKYNADGLRTYKNNSDYTTYYYYDSNGNMIALKKGSSIMYFQYDSEGNVVSMTFEGTRYYYVKNQQGDVEKIVNKLGNVVVTYKYDAWGNPCGMTDSTSSTYGIGTMNPFRYRSYIYDDDTGLYYLRSRYYDPVTGRFPNADVLIACTDINCNVFTFCQNNHINRVDKTGLASTKLKYPGEIHSQVQNDICKRYKKMKKEARIKFTNGKYGRADLLKVKKVTVKGKKEKKNCAFIWEIKPISTKYKNAEKQISKYVSGTWIMKNGMESKMELHKGGYIKGNEFKYNEYYVSYYYDKGGIIRYQYYEEVKSEPQTSNEFDYTPVLICAGAGAFVLTCVVLAPVTSGASLGGLILA